MIIIGSRALMLRNKDLVHRPKDHIIDFDFVCSQSEYEEWKDKNLHKVNPTKIYQENNKWIWEAEKTPCEFEIVEPEHSSELLVQAVMEDPETISFSFGGMECSVISLDACFALKDSHKYKKFDNQGYSQWWKNTIDWHIMKQAGAQVSERYVAFRDKRSSEVYNYSHPKLNVSKDQFFDEKANGFVAKFDHDDIHKSVSLYEDIPAYCRYLQNNSSVMCSKKKFFEQPRHIQLAGVIEEGCVLAIERSKSQYGDLWSDDFAWKFAISKICSTITSGWFREFAHSNVFEVLKLYPSNYWIKFQEDVKAGKVRPFSGKLY